MPARLGRDPNGSGHILQKAGFKFDYQDRPTNGLSASTAKSSLHLPGCEISVWGKPDLGVVCEACQRRMSRRIGECPAREHALSRMASA
jgi:hypothetical protein